ncbi:MAG: DUF2306 domain-containing protein [Alphaproteobacteria bacterium]|nr:DUF2306 domain-containing protein [Alphaproteobacteria bacterium]
MPTAVAIHLVFALIALVLGGVMLVRPKGTRSHRTLGWTWVTAMALVALSSLWIPSFLKLSWIHGFTLVTAVALPRALLAIRRGRVRAHRAGMIGTFIGLIGAGIGALAPGRLVGGTILGWLGWR